jgi:hypothetical protein
MTNCCGICEVLKFFYSVCVCACVHQCVCAQLVTLWILCSFSFCEIVFGVPFPSLCNVVLLVICFVLKNECNL